MGFGAGALISAVAYDLMLDAREQEPGAATLAAGIVLGAIVFFIGDYAIERRGNANTQLSGDAENDENKNALAIMLGTVLDGVPESAVIGASLVTGNGVSAAMVAAAFISNVPESLGATSGLERAGLSTNRVIGMWAGIVLVSGLSALAGYVLLDGASPRLGAFLQAFAAGSILTMLADSMIPEAYKKGGPLVGLATVLGFSLAFWISLAD